MMNNLKELEGILENCCLKVRLIEDQFAFYDGANCVGIYSYYDAKNFAEGAKSVNSKLGHINFDDQVEHPERWDGLS